MAKASTKKTSSAAKKTSSSHKTAGGKSTSARSASSSAKKKSTGSKKSVSAVTMRSSGKKQSQSSSVGRDLFLIFVIAAAAILFCSLFGIIGTVGKALAGFEFGLFGSMAYLFPFLLLVLAFFTMSNFRRYPANTVGRIFLALLTFSLLCGLIELIGSDGAVAEKLTDYYAVGRGTHLHGGLFGGFWCRLLMRAFGKAGSYILLILLFLAGLVATLGRALLTPLGIKSGQMVGAIRDESKRRREDTEERRRLAELRAEERLLKRAEEREARAQARTNLEETDLKKAAAETPTQLQLKEVRLKREALDRQEAARKAAEKEERSTEKPAGPARGSGMEGQYSFDLSTTTLPVDDQMAELLEEIEAHKAEQPQQKKERRTLRELEDLDEEKPAPRIARRKAPAGETAALAQRGTTVYDRKAEPETAEKASEGEELLRKGPWKKQTEELRINLMPEPAEEEEVSGDIVGFSEEREPAESWEDPREQLKKLENESIFRTESDKNTSGSGGRVLSGGSAAKTKAKTEPAAAAEESAALTVQTPPQKNYKLPPTNLLKRGQRGGAAKESELKRTAALLENTLRNFGVEVTVTDISCGPSVTRYELRPEQGVKVSRISALADDIKLALAATEIRIEAPIPGKSAVGIEVPNTENQTVYLRTIVENEEFTRSHSKIAFAVGQDIGGKVIVADLAKMPHLLIAGATGSGKSVCINSLIVSMLYRAKPDEVQFIMIDPKVVELGVYNGIPHLRIPVVTDPKLAAEALNGAVKEMTGRYKKFADLNVRDIKSYNAKIRENPEEYADREPLPQIVVIVDEFADLMMVASNDVEQAVCRLAQLARAAGIHLVLATQRPSVNVITGLIKANIQSRIALAVSSGVDSRTIIDMNGAEKLLGKGDMLFYPTGYPKPVRVQGCWVSDDEIENIVNFWKKQNELTEEDMAKQNRSWMHDPVEREHPIEDERDELFIRAADYVISSEKASIGNFQRVFRIGFNRAARLMDQLAEAGIVGAEEGTKARQIMMDAGQLADWKRENGYTE